MSKRKTKVETERDRLLAAVWELSETFWMWTLSELAEEANLAPSTVWKLYHGVTIGCRSSTLIKLIQATGLHIQLHGKTAKAEQLLRKLAA